jgi:hypothetical protein
MIEAGERAAERALPQIYEWMGQPDRRHNKDAVAQVTAPAIASAVRLPSVA